jgi:hypothetical protein
MHKKIKYILFSILICHSLTGYCQDPERKAVLLVAKDYVEAMYQADATKMDKCLHEPFVKNGFYWKGSQETFSEMTSLSRAQLIQIAKDWNKEQWVPDDAPRELDILDLQEKIAVVKLTAFWGVEYLQLAKTEKSWLIVQILSENWPKKETGQDQQR